MNDEQTEFFCRKLRSLAEDYNFGSETGVALMMADQTIRRLNAEVEKFAGYLTDCKEQRRIMAENLMKLEARLSTRHEEIAALRQDACDQWEETEQQNLSGHGDGLFEALEMVRALLPNDQAEASGARGRPIANPDAPAALPPAHGWASRSNSK